MPCPALDEVVDHTSGHPCHSAARRARCGMHSAVRQHRAGRCGERADAIGADGTCSSCEACADACAHGPCQEADAECLAEVAPVQAVLGLRRLDCHLQPRTQEHTAYEAADRPSEGDECHTGDRHGYSSKNLQDLHPPWLSGLDLLDALLTLLEVFGQTLQILAHLLVLVGRAVHVLLEVGLCS